MMQWDRLRDTYNRCHNCNSSQKLELHHRIFRSEWEQGVINNINKNKKIFSETRWDKLHTWWLHDIENLVLLCTKCHNKKIHWGDYKLREFYRNSFTEPNTLFNISFKKPLTNLF